MNDIALLKAEKASATGMAPVRWVRAYELHRKSKHEYEF